MIGESGTPRKRRSRPLSDHERELWGVVTRAIKPLKPKRRVKLPTPAQAPAEVNAAVEPADPVAPARPAPGRRTPGNVEGRAAKPFAPFDRRLKQRLARGIVDIDARIDLHGMTQAAAHDALRGFLRRARTDGARIVLVITGKGFRPGPTAGGERGVLRRQVPLWLKSAAMRECVLAFEPAHSGHGGEGALYVRIRRERSDPG